MKKLAFQQLVYSKSCISATSTDNLISHTRRAIASIVDRFKSFAIPKHTSIAFERCKAQAKHEWKTESGICDEIIDTSLEVVGALEFSDGGVVSPLKEALNWQRLSTVPGQLHHTYDLLSDALKVFQGKPFWKAHPKPDPDAPKYLTPTGRSQMAGFVVNSAFQRNQGRVWYLIQTKTKQLTGVDIPIACPINGKPKDDRIYGFWSWVIDNPSIPRVVTEGLKKAGKGVSSGYVTIALAGVSMGRVSIEGEEIDDLQPDLAELVKHPGTSVKLAFDYDTKPATVIAVGFQLIKLAKSFEKYQAQVEIIRLPSLPDGSKAGLDDYIVEYGIEAFDRLFDEAVTIEQYQAWYNTFKWQYERSQLRQIKPSELQDSKYVNTDNAPNEGILALESAKGTGKTEAIARLIEGEKKVLLLTHLVALGGNLADRLSINFKNNLDTLPDGTPIPENGDASAYDRYGLCIQSLATINPEDYRDGVIVIDEVDQLLRTLLTSDTCNKNGLRGVLLSRLEQVIKVARLVIISSADVCDADIDYICQLRGDRNPYLIRNIFKPTGYTAHTFDSEDRLKSEFMDDVRKGLRVYAATDSLETSAHLFDAIEGIIDNAQILLINSDTRQTDTRVTEYLDNPNLHAHKYQTVIASPTAATGISIDGDCFDVVYGFFSGKSIIASDMAQALARVRKPVTRKIWVNQTGQNFSKVSKSTKLDEILKALENKANAELEQLAIVFRGIFPLFNLGDNPHSKYFAHSHSQQNNSMYGLKTDLIEQLKFDGNNITEVKEKLTAAQKLQIEADYETFKEAIAMREELKQEKLKAAPILPDEDLKELQALPIKTPEQKLTVDANLIARAYGIDEINDSVITYDRKGKTRAQLFETLCFLSIGYAASKSIGNWERQHKWQKGITPQDIKPLIARAKLRRELGLCELFEGIEHGQVWTDQDCRAIADRVRDRIDEVKTLLNPGFKSHWSDRAIVKSLGKQLLLDFTEKKIGSRGDQQTVMTVDLDSWQEHKRVINHNYKTKNIAQYQNITTHLDADYQDLWLGFEASKNRYQDEIKAPKQLLEKICSPYQDEPYQDGTVITKQGHLDTELEQYPKNKNNQLDDLNNPTNRVGFIPGLPPIPVESSTDPTSPKSPGEEAHQARPMTRAIPPAKPKFKPRPGSALEWLNLPEQRAKAKLIWG